MIRLLLILGLLTCGIPLMAAPTPDQDSFVQEMVDQHGFDANALRQLLAGAKVRQSILAAIARPAEKRLNWGQYRKIFLTRERIRGGLAYWKRNADSLQRAHKQFGIPPEIIIAIIGVETRYGRHAGSYPVLDALSTLAFHYPPRSRFFRDELEQFLLLARQEKLDPREPIGSYAGAMGTPQFMPSSYQAYAIDFDGDGRRDIWDNSADVIGSVANYLARHGWRTGEPVARRAQGAGVGHTALTEKGYKPYQPVSDFNAAGIRTMPPLPAQMPAALLALKTDQGTQYWLALTNFYAITRYNHSPLYAMAVYQLADAIKQLHRSTKDD